MIQDIDYELRYIMCSTNSVAKMYLNTLGFFISLQKKVERLKAKEDARIQVENVCKSKFYLEYKEKLEYQNRFLNSELTP